MIETLPFVRKPFQVHAVQITEQNMDEAAAWCLGEIQIERARNGRPENRWIQVDVHRPQTPRQSRAYIGDWLLYAGKGFKVYTNKAFSVSFDQVEGAPAVLHGPATPPVDRSSDSVVVNVYNSGAPKRPVPTAPKKRPAKVGAVGEALQQAQAELAVSQETVDESTKDIRQEQAEFAASQETDADRLERELNDGASI